MDTEPTSNARTVEDYLKLLLAFRGLPETKIARTFMEVSGYPHYENVCSNILRFYFDPSAEHGLRDMLLSAFLSMASQGDLAVPEEVSLSREHAADDQKRIDLVIDCENFTLGIENKIYHWEANDFENYGRVLDHLGKDKATIKAVLCLRTNATQPALNGGFIRYTYEQLWEQVRSTIGHYLPRANAKWVTCLLDFMETTTNLTGPSMELKKTDLFFIEHHAEIELLIDERNAFLGRLRQKVANLLPIVSDMEEAKLLSGKPWVYERIGLVLDYQVEDSYSISFDLYIRPSGWELQMFGRNSKSSAKLASILNHPSLAALGAAAAPIIGGRHIVQTWPIDTDLGEISNTLRSWMQALASASGLNHS
ncbi:MAG: PD-(D/E)XK nuclease family protein [Verrucomicrobiota bacterium]